MDNAAIPRSSRGRASVPVCHSRSRFDLFAFARFDAERLRSASTANTCSSTNGEGLRFTLHLLETLRHKLVGLYPLGKLHALGLSGRILARRLIEAFGLVRVSMPAHQAMNCPRLHRLRMDFQRLSDFIEGKHPQVAEPIIARFEPVAHLDSSDGSSGKGLVCTGTHSTLIEDGRNPTVGVLIEQPVDFRYDFRVGHAEFPSAQRLGENQSVIRSPSES